MSSSAAPIPFARSMLREHRHVCAFFNSPREEYHTLLPFICDGINCGQRAFHVLPSQHRDDHLGRLRDAGIDVEGGARNAASSKSRCREDTYLRTGRFNKDAMLALIQEALQGGERAGLSARPG